MSEITDKELEEAKRRYWRENARKWRANNLEKSNENARKWRANNREHYNSYQKKWQSENPDKIKAYKRSFYLKKCKEYQDKAELA